MLSVQWVHLIWTAGTTKGFFGATVCWAVGAECWTGSDYKELCKTTV